MTKDLQQIREALEESLYYFRTEFPGNKKVWAEPVSYHCGGLTPNDMENLVVILDNLIAKEQAMGDASKGAESALPESTSSSAATPSPARLVEKLEEKFIELLIAQDKLLTGDIEIAEYAKLFGAEYDGHGISLQLGTNIAPQAKAMAKAAISIAQAHEVDLEVCARAAYAASPARLYGTTEVVSWEDAAPPYKDDAFREARAVLTAVGVKWRG